MELSIVKINNLIMIKNNYGRIVNITSVSGKMETLIWIYDNLIKSLRKKL